MYLPAEAAVLSWQQPACCRRYLSLIIWEGMSRIYCELPTKVMLKLSYMPQMQKAATTASPEIVSGMRHS